MTQLLATVKLFNFIHSDNNTSNYFWGTLLKTKYYTLRTINTHPLKLTTKLTFCKEQMWQYFQISIKESGTWIR